MLSSICMISNLAFAETIIVLIDKIICEGQAPSSKYSFVSVIDSCPSHEYHNREACIK